MTITIYNTALPCTYEKVIRIYFLKGQSFVSPFLIITNYCWLFVKRVYWNDEQLNYSSIIFELLLSEKNLLPGLPLK
jgi:hypothetical protein